MSLEHVLIVLQIEFVKDKASKEPFPPQEGVAMGVHELGKPVLALHLQRVWLINDRYARAI